jgi:hypothetical protein
MFLGKRRRLKATGRMKWSGVYKHQHIYIQIVDDEKVRLLTYQLKI